MTDSTIEQMTHFVQRISDEDLAQLHEDMLHLISLCLDNDVEDKDVPGFAEFSVKVLNEYEERLGE